MFRCLLALALSASPVSAADPTVAELVKQLETGSVGERVIAAELLGERGPTALDAAPALAKAASGAKVGDAAKWSAERRENQFLLDACLDSLAKIGPKAATHLAELLEHPEFVIRREVALVFATTPSAAAGAVSSLTKALSHWDDYLVFLCARALGNLGLTAESAVPALVSAFRRDLSKQALEGVVEALVRIGPKAHPTIKKWVVPVVVTALEERDTWINAYAALHSLGELGEPAVDALVPRIRRSKPGDRYHNLHMLLGLGPAGREAFAALGAESKGEACGDWLHALWDCPPDIARQFEPTLLAMFTTEQERVSDHALFRLARFEPKAADEIVRLVEPKAKGRVNHIVRLGPSGVRAAIRLLGNRDPAVRAEAARALGSIPRPRPTSALATLRLMAKTDPDAHAAVSAAIAAAKLSLDAADLAPVTDRKLLDRLHPEPHDGVMWDVVFLRPFAEKVFAPLLAPPAPTKSVPELIRELKAKPSAADGVSMQLALYGPKAKDAAHELAVSLRFAKVHPGNILEALRSIGPAGTGAVPELREGLRTGGPYREILFALGAIGPGAKDAVPELVKLVTAEDDEHNIVLEAAVCLGRIGPAAKDALPALKKLQTTPNPRFRLAVAFALARIENDVPKYRDTIARLSRAELKWGLEVPAGNGFAEDPLAIPLIVFNELPPEFPDLLSLAMAHVGVDCGPHYRELSAESLKRYGVRAVPALVRELRNQERLSSTEATRLLGGIGPAARDALPELRRIRDEEGGNWAVLAHEAIREIEGK